MISSIPLPNLGHAHPLGRQPPGLAEPVSAQCSPVLARVKGRCAFPSVTLDPGGAPGWRGDTPVRPKNSKGSRGIILEHVYVR